MNRFITLPSGLRINCSHILSYERYAETADRVHIQMAVKPDAGTSWRVEALTLEQMDALMNGSPIVEPAINLDRLKEGAGCCFTHEGTNRHGVIQEIHAGALEPNIFVVSQGERFQVMPKSELVVCLGQ